MEPFFAQDADPLVHERLVSRRRAEAERGLGEDVFEPRGDVEQRGERFLGPGPFAGHVRDQRGQFPVDFTDLRTKFPRPAEAQHGHGLVGLDLAEPLNDAPHTLRTDFGPDEKHEAHVPVLVDAEIAGHDGAVVQHTADSETVGDEPVAQLGRDGIVTVDLLDPDQGRGDAHARRLGQPVFGEHVESAGIEGRIGHAIAEDRVGDELGMAFPLELVLADLAEIMRRAGLRVLGAVAVEQLDQVRAVKPAVAVARVVRLLDREVGGPTGRRQRGERPRMQLVGERIA